MGAFPFRIEAAEFEFGVQVIVLGVLVLSAVRFVRLALSEAVWRRYGTRVWLGALAALPVILWVAWTLRRVWPAGWAVLFILLAGAAVCLLSSLTYRYATRPITRRDRRLLTGLRLVALLAAVLILLRPAFVRRAETRERPGVYFLYDTSRSMAIRDGTGGVSRIEELIGVYSTTERRLERLNRRFDVERLSMHAELTALDTLSNHPDGPATALGPALRTVVDRTEGREVAAIVVLSDGSHNTGIDPDRVLPVLAAREVPVFTMGFGKDKASGQVRDVAVRTILCNPTVFTGNLFPVVGELALLGVKGEPVTVELLFDEKVVDTKQVTAAEASDMQRATLAFTPDAPGIHKVTVRAQAVPGELMDDNNEASTYVNVLSGGLGVLYVEGKARWEFKFLRRTLEASQDFQVTPLLILAPLGPGQRTRLPDNAFKWARYEVIILGDVKPGVFTNEELEALNKAVSEQGKGLMMIGGYDAFGPGGWGATPIADALPVRMAPGDGHVKGLYHMTPARSAARHFVLQIEETPAATRRAWGALPELDGANLFSGHKPGAEVLATGKNDQPLLVAQAYGKGRALAFGADSTWRWAFSEHDTQKYHKRFWRQIVLWLARRDKAEGEHMWITLDKQRIRLGEKVQITAHVQDSVGRALPNCEVRADVTGPKGVTASLSFNFTGDAYHAAYEPPARGDYAVTAHAARAGKDIGDAEAKFVVYVPDVELERPVADLDRLRNMAARTGGAYFSPDQAGDLYDAIEQRDVPDTVIVRTDIIHLWDNWPMLLIFLGALTAEWIIRKRKGLV